MFNPFDMIKDLQLLWKCYAYALVADETGDRAILEKCFDLLRPYAEGQKRFTWMTSSQMTAVRQKLDEVDTLLHQKGGDANE